MTPTPPPPHKKNKGKHFLNEVSNEYTEVTNQNVGLRFTSQQNAIWVVLSVSW